MAEIDVYGRYLIRPKEVVTLDGYVGFALYAVDTDNPPFLLNHGAVTLTNTQGYTDTVGLYGGGDDGFLVGFDNFAGAAFTVRATGASSDALGVYLQGSSTRFTNSGEFSVSAASGDATGVEFGDGDWRNFGHIQVEASGSAVGLYLGSGGYQGSASNDGAIQVEGGGWRAVGVAVSEGSTFVNHGDIQATGTATVVDGVQVDTFFAPAIISNTGTISATATTDGVKSAAIELVTRGDTDPCEVDNSGILRGDYAVLETALYGEDQNIIVRNTGQMFGDISLGFAIDQVFNAGSIKGDILLSFGDDLYDGQAGRIHGAVFGGLSDDTLLGGKGGDHLYGDDGVDSGQDGDDLLSGGQGSDALYGEDGDDTLIGGKGADTLTGGYGHDVFAYQHLGDSTVARADLIDDLKAADVIDLSRIDADATQAGDQAFTLVTALDGHAGEAALVYDAGAGLTRLELDVDGDGQADALILIHGDHADFVNFVL